MDRRVRNFGRQKSVPQEDLTAALDWMCRPFGVGHFWDGSVDWVGSKFSTIRNKAAPPLDYKTLLKPGTVSLLDLSDSGMSELTNIVIADLLRGVQDAQR